MQHQWSALEITEIVSSRVSGRWPRDPKAYQDAHFAVCHASRRDAYFGLVNVFPLTSNQLGPQRLAGKLLCGVYPHAFEEPESLVLRLLSCWNVSASDLPRYCVRRFGRLPMLKVLYELEGITLPERDRAALNSFLFWVSKFREGPNLSIERTA